MIHQFYSKVKFLEKYIPESFLKEKNLLRALNFVDLKVLDKEYILVSFAIWLMLFLIFLFSYLIIAIFKPDILVNFIAYTQLFLGVLVLLIYYYPIFLEKRKMQAMKEEFTIFFLHFKILVESGLNFNQIVAYLISNKGLPYETIKKEFERIYNYSKLYNISIIKAFKKIVSNYPDFYIKSLFLDLINYQNENEDLRNFVNETWKRINLINEEEEGKFFSKLDFFMDFYSIILLIFPFLLILITFIFESVNFIFDKVVSTSYKVEPFSTMFAKTIIFLLITLPLAYISLLIIIDFLVPPHLKFLRKLREKLFK